MSPKLYLLDGHAHAYKAFHAVEGLSNSAGEPTGAVFGFLAILHRIRKTYTPTHLAVVFDPHGPSFRQAEYAEYKANRAEQPPELTVQLDTIRQILAEMQVPVFEQAPFEADDVLASLATWAVNNGGEACIVSIDKDLLQCVRPGVTVLREHLGKIDILDEAGVFAKMNVRPDQVATYLGLLGDSSDNIPGVPGIGAKTAAALLAEHDNLDAMLAAAAANPVKKLKLLAEHADRARASTRLATVKDDVEFPNLSWDSFAWEYRATPGLRAMLQRLEFRTLLDELGGTTIEQRTVDYAVLRTEAELARAIEQIRASGFVAIDTETTGLDPFVDELVGISISWKRDQAIYVPLSRQIGDGLLSLDRVRAALGPVLDPASGVWWIAHNWCFDWKFLHRARFPVGDIAFDTMIAAYLIQPDRPSKGLKSLALEMLGVKMTEYREVAGSMGGGDDLVSLAEVDVEAVGRYACQDADMTRQLAEKFGPQLDEGGLRPLFDAVEVPLCTAIARMELEGVAINREHFATMARDTTAALHELTRRAYELAGRVFNLNSTQQLAQILFDERGLTPGKKTKTGYSTDVDVLERLAPLDPLPATILEYRQLEKLRGTYIEAIPAITNPRTGRVHSSFNQTVAATGRLSSSDPNLQNIPVRTDAGRDIRRGFVPREPGWQFLAADYSQIELRILAHLSGDEALGNAFRTGGDIHTLTASKVYGVDAGDVTKEMRSSAKAINFGIIYGMSAFRLSNDLEIDRATADRFIHDYFELYKGVRAFIDHTLEECRANGFVRTMLGRRRYIPDIGSRNPNARSQAERIAVNTPIQGTSADMIKKAMVAIDRRLRAEGLRSRMLLQVHDELVFEFPPEERDVLEALVRAEMNGALPLSVPVQVDVEVGPTWADV